MALSLASHRLFGPANKTLRISSRAFSRHSVLRSSDDKPGFAFGRGPAPPRLPREDQEIFEELQRQSTGAFSTPRTPPKINQSPHSESENAAVNTSGDEEHHPDLRGGLQPEFEGEKNPKTGEVNGPKNEPLRWGAEGDWSYGGRVTDF
ncbi:putative mitochondrial protein, conserved [Aspergillus hancockii]|nr:putative mitochondrial protein, conserved [Aspergillus hancockii]